MDPNTEQLIEDYLFDRLPQEEAEQVRKRAATDPAFANLLAERELETAAMALAEEDRLRASMDSWTLPEVSTEKKSPLKVVRRRKPVTRWLSIAAGLLIFIFAGTSFYATNKYSNRQLADRYARSQVAGARSIGNDTTLDQAKANMAASRYQDAITILRDAEGNTAAMLRGEAFFKLEQYNQSIAEYDVVAKSDSQLADKATFQRALALLAVGRAKEAKQQLRELAEDPTHPFSKSAGEVLEAIDSFWRKLAW